ncbi:hypothetical protein [Bradyrhizobium sp. Tv2a-2]|uniref:hypothetical protein n=1 Tax=Bradyrhizobium sp. Tv2a-2 TaxID=113395 RepID=UPI0004292BF4|nr:hypothetical protein [Bradyrhizobium sp. Tv2a-2]
MKERPPKPRKSDFADMGSFMRASAEWAQQWNVWPWGGPDDEDDQYVYDATEDWQ